MGREEHSYGSEAIEWNALYSDFGSPVLLEMRHGYVEPFQRGGT